MFGLPALHENVALIGGGKLDLPDNAVVAFALGADMVNVAREAMLAVGYDPGCGYPSVHDRDRIIAAMDATDEAETGTRGPPETAEEGPPATQAVGDASAPSIDL